MIRGNRAWLLSLVLSALMVNFTPREVAADDPTLEQMAQDIVVVEITLNVNHRSDYFYKAGDPPATARSSEEITFRRSGVYTLVRLKPQFGGRYVVVPGFMSDPAFPPVRGIGVSQTHTCQDNQGLIIGRQTQDLSASAEVHPASGGIELHRVEGPGDKVQIRLLPWLVQTDKVPCPAQPDCFDMGSFCFDGHIGEDPHAEVEDEHGALECPGFELASLEWSLLKAISHDAELPLAIPLSINHVRHAVDEDDPPGRTVVTYHVSGLITPAWELPLAAPD